MVSISKKETYLLELDWGELEFLLEVINKMQLDENSSSEAFELLRRFKDLHKDIMGEVEPLQNNSGLSADPVDIEESAVFVNE